MGRRRLALLLIVTLSGCAGDGNPERRAEAVGAGLCAFIDDPGEVPGLLGLGAKLRESLAGLRGEVSAGCAAETRGGDAPAPLGDGSGTHHMMLRAGGREILGLRLAYDQGRDAFHVLGFWTPLQSEPRPPAPAPVPAATPHPESVRLERKTATLQKTGERAVPGISYPEVQWDADPELRDRIQETVGLRAGTGKSLDEWQAGYEGFDKVDYEVHYNDRSLLSVTYTMEGSGAGTFALSKNIVVDLKTGRQLRSPDLFEDDMLPALAAKLDATLQGEIEEIRRRLIEESGPEWAEELDVAKEWSFQVEDLDSFYLDGRGLTFTMEFGLPSLKRYLEPSWRYFLSFDDLAPFIDWDGPLSRFH